MPGKTQQRQRCFPAASYVLLSRDRDDGGCGEMNKDDFWVNADACVGMSVILKSSHQKFEIYGEDLIKDL